MGGTLGAALTSARVSRAERVSGRLGNPGANPPGGQLQDLPYAEGGADAVASLGAASRPGLSTSIVCPFLSTWVPPGCLGPPACRVLPVRPSRGDGVGAAPRPFGKRLRVLPSSGPLSIPRPQREEEMGTSKPHPCKENNQYFGGVGRR